MFVITQDGDSVLTLAAREGRTEVVSLLLKAGANTYLQNKVCQHMTYISTIPIRYNCCSKKRILNAILFRFYKLHKMHPV